MPKDTGIVNIHGKAYQTVASRVSRFRDEYKETYAIVTDLVDRDNDTVVMKASIIQLADTDRVVATGYAEENRTSSSINRTSALENAETSAIGRALAAFGMAGTEYASADEVAQAIHQQSAPTLKTLEADTNAPKPIVNPQTPATEKQREIVAKELTKLDIPKEDMEGYLIERFGVDVPLTVEGASFVIEELFAAKGVPLQPVVPA